MTMTVTKMSRRSFLMSGVAAAAVTVTLPTAASQSFPTLWPIGVDRPMMTEGEAMKRVVALARERIAWGRRVKEEAARRAAGEDKV